MESEDNHTQGENLLNQAERVAESLKDPHRGRPLLVGLNSSQSYQFIMEEQNQVKKNGWGGRRRGAGRPAKNPSTRSIALRIPEDVAEILDRQENRSAYIIEAIRFYENVRRHR